MDNFESLLKAQIQQDKLTTQPSDIIFCRLQNQMLIKSAETQTKQNGFAPLFSAFLAKKNVAWKISIAALVVFSFMSIKHIKQSNMYIQTADSTAVQQNLDTLNFQQSDTSFTY